MTSRIRSTRSRLLAGLGAAAMMATLAVGASAASASAATTDHGGGGFRPQTFTLTVHAQGNDSQTFGRAHGPVRGFFTDNETNPTSGVWDFGDRNRVVVNHTEVRIPDVNPRSCEGFAFERGRWEMTGLSGDYRHAEGFGSFGALVIVDASRADPGGYSQTQGGKHSDCDLRDAKLTIYVSGSGLATLGHHHGDN